MEFNGRYSYLRKFRYLKEHLENNYREYLTSTHRLFHTNKTELLPENKKYCKLPFSLTIFENI